MRIFVIAAIFIATLSTSATASFLGRELKQLCENDTATCDLLIIESIRSYQTGLYDATKKHTNDVVKSFNTESIAQFCLPNPHEADKMRKAVIDIIELNPDLLTDGAHWIIRDAMRETYPCK
ncbi:MAG: Rap1a/Tai family immunity protein [Cohaesibacter sp.]|jgi:hypothetical protein|nr:Rap1a/Tai family immunity protein [Cohaesibacter sp.]